MIELTHRNTRRYGGYLVHMGIVLMFIGWSGHPFNQTAVGEVNKGDTMRVGAYTLKVADLTEGDTPGLPVGHRDPRSFEKRPKPWVRSSPRGASIKSPSRELPKSRCVPV